MPRTISEMTTEALAEAGADPKGELAAMTEQLTRSGAIQPVPEAPAPEVDPMKRGFMALRAEDPDARRMEEYKGGKNGPGVVYEVLMPSTGEIVLLQQFHSGRFVVFGRRADAVGE